MEEKPLVVDLGQKGLQSFPCQAVLYPHPHAKGGYFLNPLRQELNILQATIARLGNFEKR